jgi:hypothetical protein
MIWLCIVLVSIAGIAGSVTSNWSIQGYSWAWPFVSTIFSASVWAWMTKQNINPWTMSLVFDLVYTITWFGTFVLLGNEPTMKQALALVFMLIGMTLAV